jgi:Mrp family chromosome partitioning ATPase/capsular polysaccharide biosynthesis protein
MEAIDYPGALRKSWRLLLVLAVVGGIIGYLLPTGHAKSKASVLWGATATAGAPPGKGAGPNAGFTGGIPTDQIVFFAQSTEVAETAAQSVGINIPPSAIEGYVQVQGPTKKTGTQGVVQITTYASSATKAAAFTNAFVTALANYIQSHASSQQSSEQNQLEKRISQINDQISKASASKSPTSASTVAQLQQELSAIQAQLGQLASTPTDTRFQPLETASAKNASIKGGGATSAISTSLKASHKVRGLIGFAVGLLLACVLVFLREMLDKRIRGASRAEETFGYPVVAEIPAAPAPSLDAGGGRVVSLVDVSREPASPTAEAYRMLRMSVLFEGLAVAPAYDSGGTQVYGASYSPPTPTTYAASGERSPYQGPVQGSFDPPFQSPADPRRGLESGSPPSPVPAGGGSPTLLPSPGAVPPGGRKVILVVSPGTEATRPFVVANLAATYAEAGQRVLVMSSTELHSTRRAGYGRSPSGELRPSDLEPFVQPSHLDNISRLSMSHFIGVSGQLVTRAPALLNAARQLADVVFVEAPSLLAVHDGEALTPAVDAVLVVGEVMTTTFEQAKRAGDLLRRIGAPVLGVVLTNVRLGTGDTRRRVPQPWETAPPPPGLHHEQAVEVPK